MALHFVIREDDDSYWLEKVKASDFVADGTKVLAVAVSDEVTHLIDLGVDGKWAPNDDGTLVLRANNGAPWLRLYRNWIYAEVRPFKKPTAGRVHVL